VIPLVPWAPIPAWQEVAVLASQEHLYAVVHLHHDLSSTFPLVCQKKLPLLIKSELFVRFYDTIYNLHRLSNIQ
jgi:hypothetical protein